jgi:hypothetical protein
MCPRHTAPNLSAETRSRTRVSREPDGHRQRKSPGWSGLDPRHSSCLWFQMLGVEAHSSLPYDQYDGGISSAPTSIPAAFGSNRTGLHDRFSRLLAIALSLCGERGLRCETLQSPNRDRCRCRQTSSLICPLPQTHAFRRAYKHQCRLRAVAAASSSGAHDRSN